MLSNQSGKSQGSICLGGSKGRPLLVALGLLLVSRACSLEKELNAEWTEQDQLEPSAPVGHLSEP